MHTHTQTHMRAHTQSAQTITRKTHGNTHTSHELTSTQTQIDIEVGISPQGVNVNTCPCHTHKDEGCRLVRPHVCQDGIGEEFCSAFVNYVVQKLEGFSRPAIPLTALHLRRAARLLSTLQLEQSVKGKKEINSTLTNVNKVLLEEQR